MLTSLLIRVIIQPILVIVWLTTTCVSGAYPVLWDGAKELENYTPYPVG